MDLRVTHHALDGKLVQPKERTSFRLTHRTEVLRVSPMCCVGGTQLLASTRGYMDILGPVGMAEVGSIRFGVNCPQDSDASPDKHRHRSRRGRSLLVSHHSPSTSNENTSMGSSYPLRSRWPAGLKASDPLADFAVTASTSTSPGMANSASRAAMLTTLP